MMSEQLTLLEKKYFDKINSQLKTELYRFFSDSAHIYNTSDTPSFLSSSQEYSHKDRLFEWTTHPSQTWDTLVKQKKKEAKELFIKDFLADKKNKFEKHSLTEWKTTVSEKWATQYATEITETCHRRLLSLQNSKIPAHSDMTAELLQKVPLFFEVFDRYKNLSGWQQEEKAEEKNISFNAFLQEQKLPTVYLDERYEAIGNAKRILQSGEKFYMWVDFDGAKRPDGIMLSIFAHLLIDDINTGGQGISEQEFVAKNSVFTLSEREYNRNTVQKFEQTDRCIYALTRQMASSRNFSENPVCISQMEQLKQKRERYLRKIVKIRDIMIERKTEQGVPLPPLISLNSFFIPRFDPLFIKALKKSDLGNNLQNLSPREIHDYNTVSHIIDQILTVNSLSAGRVCQIILAQCEGADDIKTLDRFLREKVKRWRERRSEYFAPNPIANLSLCPLFETAKTTTEEFITQTFESLIEFYKSEYKNNGKKIFEQKIEEFFFAGSDLSKSIGSSSAYINTWKCARATYKCNAKHRTDVRIKLGSGESYFRQNGFLDPKHLTSIWKKDLTDQEKNLINGISAKDFQKPASGYLSLLKKSPWLNSITLQSKAREWMEEMPVSKLSSLLKDLRSTKINNRIRMGFGIDIPEPILYFANEEKTRFETFLGTESQTSKSLDSFGSFIELFATELMPVLRDRSLKRNITNNQNSANELKNRLISSRGIQSRAIAANTASSFLFPLGLLGKGLAAQKIKEKYNDEEIKQIIKFYEPEELLQLITHASAIVPQVVKALKTGGLKNLSLELETEWKNLQVLVPYIVEAVWNKSPLKNIPKEKRSLFLPLLNTRLRGILDITQTENGIIWNAPLDNIEFLKEIWSLLAKDIVIKAAEFLSGKTDQYPFNKQDQEKWDIYMTMSCRMRWDSGILG